MSTPTSMPAGEPPADVDKERRNAIVLAAAVGGAGAVAMAVPFVSSFAPSERAKAAGAPVEFDVAGMAPGEMKTIEWRGLPVWVLRRTPEMLQSIRKVDGEVADPKSQRTQYPTPEYARNEYRSRKPEYLVAVGICTHLGCSPQGPFAPNQNSQLAPRFEVDPFWPKPMPNNWVMGMTIGIGISSDDHVWVLHRGNDPGNLDRTELAVVKEGAPRVGECCNPAPPVLEFDAAGNLVGSWGGQPKDNSYDWPESNHGIVVDHKGFVWIGGNGGPDSPILKFTRDGKFVAQYGKKNVRLKEGGTGGKPNFVADSNDMNNFGRVAKIFMAYCCVIRFVFRAGK